MTFNRELEERLAHLDFITKESYTGFNLWSHQNLMVLPVSLDSYAMLEDKERFELHVLEKYQDAHVVFVWEDRWRHQKDIILSRIASFLNLSEKVHGRQTKVVSVTKPEMKKFLEENHMHGYTPGKFNYGLTLKGDLVAAAVFGRGVTINRAFGPSVSHELIRFCYKNHIHVRGGLTKLLQRFIRDAQPGDIYTAVDREWSRGEGFLRLGFEIMGYTDPIPFWINSSGLRFRIQVPDSLCVYNAGNVKLLYVP